MAISPVAILAANDSVCGWQVRSHNDTSDVLKHCAAAVVMAPHEAATLQAQASEQNRCCFIKLFAWQHVASLARSGCCGNEQNRDRDSGAVSPIANVCAVIPRTP